MMCLEHHYGEPGQFILSPNPWTCTKTTCTHHELFGRRRGHVLLSVASMVIHCDGGRLVSWLLFVLLALLLLLLGRIGAVAVNAVVDVPLIEP